MNYTYYLIFTLAIILQPVFLLASSVTVQRTHYSYHDKFQNEDDTKIALMGRMGNFTIVPTVESVNRYGMEDTQYGLDLYSPIGSKDNKMYVYVGATNTPGAKFLPQSEYSASLYKGVLTSTELGLGFKEMIYDTQTIKMVKFMGSTNLPLPSFRIGETITYVTNDGTCSYDTFIGYDNENKLKVKYIYGFGNSTADFGIAGVRTLKHHSSTVLVNYKFTPRWELGGSYVNEVYETLYTKDGGSVNVTYSW